MNTNYQEFLENKIPAPVSDGFHVELSQLHENLAPHTKDCVQWMLAGGRRALFADFGLHKTRTQLECLRQIVKKHSDKMLNEDKAAWVSRTLIVAPLGVKYEFESEAKELNMDVQYVTCDADIEKATTPFLITNYERLRDGGISPSHFIAISLDEAAVLRNFNTKQTQAILTMFGNVRYRFTATATPSPNRLRELLNYSEYLDIMPTMQAFTRWFKRDSTKAKNLKLMPHKEEEFWAWVSTWAIFIKKPSDLGHSDEKYHLPGFAKHEHVVKADQSNAGDVADRDGQRLLIRSAALGLQEASREKRETLALRVEKMMEIVRAEPDTHWIIWHDLEDERKMIEAALADYYADGRAVSVFGAQSLEQKEKNLIAFAKGEVQILATKPSIAGCGCNFQYHCHRALYLGIGYDFEDFIQSVHRIYRFNQQHPVDIHIIYADTEEEVYKTLLKKWQEHDRMVETMTALIREHGLNRTGKTAGLLRKIGVNRQEVKGNFFKTVNNDTVLECAHMPDECVDLIVTSIPFGDQYEYEESYNDFGCNSGNEAFFRQMDYLTPNLYRILKPGRIAAIHVKDRIRFGSVTGNGFTTIEPFSDDASAHFRKHGFQLLSRITVATDVVTENSSSYRLGWTENGKDGTKMGNGLPEYVLILRKPPTDRSNAYADEPVFHSRTGIRIDCPSCGFFSDNLPDSKGKTDFVKGSTDQWVCPECHYPSGFETKHDHYTRGRWQLDANGNYNTDGETMPIESVLERVRRMEPKAALHWWRRWCVDNPYDYELHVALCEELDKAGKLPTSFMLMPPISSHPEIWSDITRVRTLNTSQSQSKRMFHVCPLQLDIVKRLIVRYTNEGEVVFDPFAGIGTVPYMAVKLKRTGWGVELNTGYWKESLHYLKKVESLRSIGTLFGDADVEEDAEVEGCLSGSLICFNDEI